MPLSAYLCTLSQGCFELSDCQHSTTTEGPNCSCMVTSDQLVLSEMAMLKIQNIFQDNVSDTLAQSKSSVIPVIAITDETVPDNYRSADHWIKCGRVALTKKDKQLILNYYVDVHVNAFQSIARREFPQVGGFHNLSSTQNDTHGGRM